MTTANLLRLCNAHRGESIDHVKSFGLRRSGPHIVCTGHRLSAGGTGPPSVVDFVAVPGNQRGDLCGIGSGDHRLPGLVARVSALSSPVSIQKPVGLVDSVRLCPVVS